MKQVGFEKISNKDIFNILTEPENVNNKIVIMSHGFRGSSIGPARTFVDFEKLLINEGISVLRFDQPNGGNSEGDYIDSSFNEWVYTTIFFAKKYLALDYEVVLLGQSMGATTSVIASVSPDLQGKISCLLLWVPDPKSTVNEPVNEVYEEGGQKYKRTFWQEARDADFFGCLEKFDGDIHLVYGENDKYISPELRVEVIKKIQEKGQKVKILPGQEHSPWEFDIAQEVYHEELELLRKCLFGQASE